MQPHASEEPIHTAVEQPLQVHDAHRPGIAQRAQHLHLLCAHLRHGQARLPRRHTLQQRLEALQGLVERLARTLQGGPHFGRACDECLVVVRLNALHHSIQPPHQREQLKGPLRTAPGLRRVQEHHRVVHRLQQLWKPQHHQRHAVVAVEIRVQNQVGLVAYRGQQLAALAQQLAAHPGQHLRIRCRRRPGGQLPEHHAEAFAHFLCAQLLVIRLAHARQPCNHIARQRRLLGCIQKLPHEPVAQHRRIRGAHDLLACEIDGHVLFVDQDAGHIDHRRQVQQVDEHELAPHTEAAQPARNAVHECHGVCGGRPTRADDLGNPPTVVSDCYNVKQFPRHCAARGWTEAMPPVRTTSVLVRARPTAVPHGPCPARPPVAASRSERRDAGSCTGVLPIRATKAIISGFAGNAPSAKY